MHFVRLARSGHMTVPAHQQMCHTGITHIITPSTTTTTTCRHHNPLPPHYHRQPVVSVQERATRRPRNPETAPRRPCRQQHDDTKQGGRNTSKTQRTQRNTQGGGQDGPKGHRKATGRAYKVRPPFFSFFFMSTDIPPPS